MLLGLARPGNLHRRWERESDFGRIQIDVIKSRTFQDGGLRKYITTFFYSKKIAARISIYLLETKAFVCPN